MRDCFQSRVPLSNRLTEHHLCVCVKISVYPVCMLFENWSYFARDDIVCPNKLYLSIHASESPTSSWLAFFARSVIHFSLFLFLFLFRWSILKKSKECNSPNHHSSIHGQSQTTCREGKRKADWWWWASHWHEVTAETWKDQRVRMIDIIDSLKMKLLKKSTPGKIPRIFSQCYVCFACEKKKDDREKSNDIKNTQKPHKLSFVIVFRTFLFAFKLSANTYFFMIYSWWILWNDLSKLFLICLWSFPHIGVIIHI